MGRTNGPSPATTKIIQTMAQRITPLGGFLIRLIAENGIGRSKSHGSSS